MKLSKKMKSLLLTTSIVPIALTPIAVISCSSETETAVSRSATLQKNRAEAAPADSTTAPSEYTVAPEYTGAQDIITEANQSNLRDFEDNMIDTDPNTWHSAYVVPKYDDMMIRQWYANAAVDGWQSIDDFSEYQHYVYERGIKKTKNANTFGAQPSGNEASWLAFHYGPGGMLNEPGAFSWYSGDWTANVSGCAPMWKGAEKETFNHIDNKLKWYHYEGGDMNQFLFDENNKENAVKRLLHMNRIQRVSPSGLKNEEGLDVAPADGIKSEEHKITRGKYVMLDGVLTDVHHLPFGNYKMYYVNDTGATADGDSWIRDDHGWKVVVTDRDLDKMFTQVINPTSQQTVDAHPELANTSIPSTLPMFDGGISHVDAASVINYPSDYNVNKEFDIEHRFSHDVAIAKKLDATDIKLSTGKYTITQSEDSFSALATNPNIHLPYRDTRGQKLEYTGNDSKIGNWPDRFGRKGKYWGAYGENGVHLMAWAWVEDGHGGHKIWKSAERLRHLLDVWANPRDTRSVAQIGKLSGQTGLTREQLVPCKGHGDYRFYGNFQRIYPVASWYRDSEFFGLERGV